MADNYLEKQRADYETRKAAWEKAKRYKVRRTGAKSSPSATNKKQPGK